MKALEQSKWQLEESTRLFCGQAFLLFELFMLLFKPFSPSPRYKSKSGLPCQLMDVLYLM
jgi:hypothetical protein